MKIEHYFLLLGAIYTAPNLSNQTRSIFGWICFGVGIYLALKG